MFGDVKYMKANRKTRNEFISNRKAFTFIIPLTMAIVIGFSLLTIGAYIVGTIGSVLEDNLDDDVSTSGSISLSYSDDATVSGAHKLNLTGTNVGELTSAVNAFYIQCGASAVDFTLVVNGKDVNRSDNISEGEARNITWTYLVSNSSVNSTDSVITFDYTVSTDDTTITMLASGTYQVTGDYLSDNSNSTILLLGNITDGFSDVVDIEIVVIIITALSMAILAIMAVGSKRSMF